MSKSVILDGLRSPIGLKNGKIFNEELGIITRSDDLSSKVLSGLIDRIGVDKKVYEDLWQITEKEPTVKHVEKVMMGYEYPLPILIN